MAMVVEENERLREQVARLEAALFDVAYIPVEFRLTPSEARILGCLMNRRLVTKDAIMAALYRDGGKDEAEPKICDVFIHKVRRKLKPFGIDIVTVWGTGWSLTDEGRARLNSMIPKNEDAA